MLLASLTDFFQITSNSDFGMTKRLAKCEATTGQICGRLLCPISS